MRVIDVFDDINRSGKSDKASGNITTVPKSDKFTPIQYSQSQREASSKAPANPVTMEFDLPEFEKRKTIRDVAFSTIPLMDAAFPYLRAGEEARQRGEGLWSGLTGATPQAQRQRRAMQDFYQGAEEQLPDWVKVVRQTGVPGGPFFKGFEAISSSERPIVSAAGIGAGLAAPSAYLQSQSKDTGERVREGIAAMPQGAAFGGAFGLPGHIVPQLLYQQRPGQAEAPLPAAPGWEQGQIRDVLTRATAPERNPVLDMLARMDDFPASPEVRQTTAAKGIRQRVREFQGGPVEGDIRDAPRSPGPSESVVSESPSGGAARLADLDVAVRPSERSPLTQSVLGPPGSRLADLDVAVRPSERSPLTRPIIDSQQQKSPIPSSAYMATSEELAATARTPEQIKQDLKQPFGRAKKTPPPPQSGLDVNQNQPVLQRALEQQQKQKSEYLPIRTSTFEGLKRAYEKRVESINASDLPPNEKREALKNALDNYQYKFEAERSRYEEEKLRKSYAFRTSDAGKAAEEKPTAPKPGRPPKFNWPDIARNWAGVEWKSLSARDRQRLQNAYGQYVESTNAGRPQRSKTYKWQPKDQPEDQLPKPQRAQEQQQEARKLPQSILQIPERDQLFDTLNREDSASSVRDIVDKLKENKAIPGDHRRYYYELDDYLFRPTKEGYANNMTDVYFRLTGDKLNQPVKLDELFKGYQQSFKERDQKGFTKGGQLSYEKDFHRFVSSLMMYGRRVGETFELESGKAPNKAAPWLIDEAKGVAYLAPYYPDRPGLFLDKLPLDAGLKEAAKIPDEKLKAPVPEIPTGRTPGSTSHLPKSEAQRQIDILFPELSGSRPAQPKIPETVPGSIGEQRPAYQRVEQQQLARRDIPRPVGPRGGQPPKAKFQQQPVRETAPAQAWAQIQKTLSPSTISESSRESARIIRQFEGEGKRQVAQNVQRMKEYRRDIIGLGDTGKRNLIAYIQGDTKAPITPKLKKLSDSLKTIYKGYELEIKSLPRFQQQDFIENYLPQMWRDKLAADKVFRAGTWLRERKLPTYEAGIKKGLTPVTLDPIEITNRYMASMRKFLDKQYIIQAGRDAGYIKVDTGKGIRPPGTALLGSVRAPLKDGSGRTLYANEDYARALNHYLGLGFRENEAMRDLYDGALHTANGVTMLNLGLSAFHASTMVKESYIAAWADVFKSMSEGRKPSLDKFNNSVAAPISYAVKGDKLIKAYLGGNAQGRLGQVAELGARANMRLGELDEIYRPTAMGHFVETVKNIGIKQALRQTGREMVPERGRPTTYLAPITTPLAKIADVTAWPLFYYYIPRIKAGVFMERMSSFLDRKPGAPMVEQIREAQRIADIIDDQFGELVQNNIFWDNHIKQSANLLLTSTGWTLGTLRLFGQGTADIVKGIGQNLQGKKAPLTDRAAYVMSSAIIGLFTMGALYQALKSGDSPSEAKDLAAPKTGGKTSHGDIERAILPGYEKDIMGWVHAPVSEAYNKLGPLPKLTYEMLANKDWRGDPTRDTIGDAMSRIGATLLPISVAQMMKPSSPGTNIGGLERFMGIRAAGGWITNPQRDQAMQKYMDTKARARKERHEAQDKARGGMRVQDVFGPAKKAPSGSGMRVQDFFRR